MTRDEFASLKKGAIIRRMGVTFRVGDKWALPGANFGLTELTAYRQSPPWSWSIAPDDPKVAKFHIWHD